MLVPEPRPVDPRHNDGRKAPGRSSRGMRGLFRASEGAVAVSMLAFHGYKIEEAAKLVADELGRRGIRINAAKIIRTRQDLDCEKHKRAVPGEALGETAPTAWMVGHTTTAWMMQGECGPARASLSRSHRTTTLRRLLARCRAMLSRNRRSGRWRT